MKKIIGVIMVGVLLAGCGSASVGNSNSTGTKTAASGGTTVSVRDSVAKNLPIRCDYVDDNGGKTTISFQGQLVKMTGEPKNGANFESLINGNMFYLWDVNKKEGIQLDLTKIVGSSSLKMGNKPIRSVNDVVSALEEKKSNCTSFKADASVFEVPADVKITKQ